MPKLTRSHSFSALGVMSGIGTMLEGARQSGFNIVGNYDHRRSYHRRDDEGNNTFEMNFPEAQDLFGDNLEEAKQFEDVDLIIGHPKCGSFSNLRIKKADFKNKGDLPKFVDVVQQVSPKFFVMDNLAKSLKAFNAKLYHKKFPEYDLFFEWVSNYGYGNVQKNRNRLFLIGAKRELGFVFVPNEVDTGVTVRQCIGDLRNKAGRIRLRLPNMLDHVTDQRTSRGRHVLGRGRYATWGQIAKHMLKMPPLKCLSYHAADGTVKNRFSFSRLDYDRYGRTLIGTNPMLHPITGLPLSIRERARVQGLPDDFVFYGETLFDGRWNHDKDSYLIHQTGRAVPVEFCVYVTNQIKIHLLGLNYPEEGDRILKPDPQVDESKRWFCENVGYSNQKGACKACWLKEHCEIRKAKRIKV